MIRSLNKHLGIPAEVLIRGGAEPLPKALADLYFSQFPIKAMEKNGAFSGFAIGAAKISEKTEEAIRWLVGRIGGFSARATDCPSQKRLDALECQTGQLCLAWLEPPSLA